MPKLHIERSLLIEAPIHEVYQTIRDFKCWPQWSPCLLAEREARLSFSYNRSFYAWNGAVVIWPWWMCWASIVGDTLGSISRKLERKL